MSGISKMLLAGFSLGFITACVPSGELNRSKFPSNQLIIKYQEASYLNKMDKFPASDLSQLSAAAGVGLSHLRKMATDEHVLRLPQNVSDERIQQIIQKLSMHTDIQYVERDMLLQGQLVPNDTLYWYQWSLRNTGGSNMETAWDINQGMGITVAVLDSGYLPHGDLVANILPGYDLISDTTISQDGDGRDAQALDPGDWTPANACKPDTPARDSSWHGIHVAGIIGAVTNNNLGIAGVVSDAKILPVRVTGRCGGYMSDVAEGIIWAAGGTISGVPNNMHPAQVINASLGAPGTCTNTLQAAIDVARSLGSTVVVAAGNSTEDAANVLPASCAGVITVAATDSDGNRTWYTNFGSVVDLSAPGGDQQGPTMQGVISTSNTGTTTPVEDIRACQLPMLLELWRCCIH